MTYLTQISCDGHSAARVGRTYRDPHVGDIALILGPGLAVLFTAATGVAAGTVDAHDGEEDGVEPGEGAVKARDQAPGEGEEDVAGVMDFAGIAEPAVDHDGITPGRGDGLGVLDCSPRQLREGFADDQLSAFLSAVPVLLAVCGIPNPVYKYVYNIEDCKRGGLPFVFVWVVVSQEQGSMTVRQGYTGKVPEDDHKAPFLIVDVPRYSKVRHADVYRPRPEKTYQLEMMSCSPLAQALA